VHWELTESDQQLSEKEGNNGHKPHYAGEVVNVKQQWNNY
jgi:hypothetical protein